MAMTLSNTLPHLAGAQVLSALPGTAGLLLRNGSSISQQNIATDNEYLHSDVTSIPGSLLPKGLLISRPLHHGKD